MHNRDIFGQKENAIFGEVITPTNIIYREITCSNCRSKLETEGIVFIWAANPQRLTCPVCEQRIFLDVGKPPRRWSITRVLERREPPEAPPEDAKKPILVPGVIFKEIKCPYYGSKLELKGTWDPEAKPSEIACPVCKKTFSYGPIAPKTLFSWIDGHPRKWEFSRLIEARGKEFPAWLKWGTVAIGAITAIAVVRGLMKKI